MGLRKKIKKQIDKSPIYKINQEAFDNQNLARSRAFGRDRDVQMQEENIEGQMANSVGQAKDITDSSSALLATVAQLDMNKNNALRGLAQDEASLRSQKTGELYGANAAMIDEKDKAWKQNVYAPWELKLNELAAKRRRRQALTDSAVGAVTGMGALMNWGGGIDGVEGGGGTKGSGDAGAAMGAVGALFSDKNLKENIEGATIDVNGILGLNVFEYNYIGDTKKHLGLIAQQVQTVFPEAVREVNGYLQVDYNEIVPALLLVLKEQHSKIEALQSKIN